MAVHPLAPALLVLVGFFSISAMAQPSVTAPTAANYQLNASIEDAGHQWTFTDIELVNEQWSSETLGIIEAQEKPEIQQCHFKAKLTQQEDAQLLLEAVMNCESSNQHSTYELPVLILESSGGEACMEFGEQQGISWKYSIRLLAK